MVEPLDPSWQDFLNKCDECCPVDTCTTCGPCPDHDTPEENTVTDPTAPTTGADQTPAEPWSESDLRALAAEVIHRYGSAVVDTDNDAQQLHNVARWDFYGNPDPTDAELEVVREHIRDAVIEVAGVRFNDVDNDGTETRAVVEQHQLTDPSLRELAESLVTRYGVALVEMDRWADTAQEVAWDEGYMPADFELTSPDLDVLEQLVHAAEVAVTLPSTVE